MLDKIKSWWEGEVYYLDDVIPGIRYKRHWTSKSAHAIVNFYLDNWRWIWSTVIAILGLLIAL